MELELSELIGLHRLAYNVVNEYHQGQTYGDKPYIYHLEQVDNILSTFLGVRNYRLRTIGLLHDIVEDTVMTLESLRKLGFTDYIVECVGLVTDEPASTRKERKLLTNDKLSCVRDTHLEALIVKAADRLANVRNSSRGSRHYEMYKKEHAAFRTAVYREGLCDSIWEELDELIK